MLKIESALISNCLAEISHKLSPPVMVCFCPQSLKLLLVALVNLVLLVFRGIALVLIDFLTVLAPATLTEKL